MTKSGTRDAVLKEIADVVRAVPGVAFLRPGLRALLPRGVPDLTRGPSGVRLTREGAGPAVLEVQIVARRGARTLDTARDVRAAVLGALHSRPLGTVRAVRVRVTVTGVV